jgi:hypothetical protein
MRSKFTLMAELFAVRYAMVMVMVMVVMTMIQFSDFGALLQQLNGQLQMQHI